MREIKFRAWDSELDFMVSEERYKIDFNGQVFFDNDDKNLYNQTDKLKLMQYTGLLDKNGVEIYESDILEIYSKIGKTQTKGGVYYEDKVCAFMVDDKLFQQYLPLTQDDDIEVIGNIYEDSHLLDNN